MPQVLRANGNPAYVDAKPRLRQSAIVSEGRSVVQKYAAIRAGEARLAAKDGDAPQPHPLFGMIIAAGLFGVLIVGALAAAIMIGG